ncbi:hypothetical protein CHCC20333_4014 [Bacillus paralicheniformis]|nr:hypothetical protein CHCC20333_4014 [Bacillus paralicheniformis]
MCFFCAYRLMLSHVLGLFLFLSPEVFGCDGTFFILIVFC